MWVSGCRSQGSSGIGTGSLVATGKIAMFLLHLCDDVIVQIPV